MTRSVLEAVGGPRDGQWLPDVGPTFLIAIPERPLLCANFEEALPEVSSMRIGEYHRAGWRSKHAKTQAVYRWMGERR